MPPSTLAIDCPTNHEKTKIGLKTALFYDMWLIFTLEIRQSVAFFANLLVPNKVDKMGAHMGLLYGHVSFADQSYQASVKSKKQQTIEFSV